MSEKQNVTIQMEVNSYVALFGVPLMICVMILGAMAIQHVFMTPAPAPIHIATQSQAPTIQNHVAVPPANVTVQPADVPVNIMSPDPQPIFLQAPPPYDIYEKIQFSLPEGQKGEVKIVEKVVEKTKQIPIYVPTADKAEITIDDIYNSADRYLKNWCAINGKDSKAEHERWMSLWNSRVMERGGDEQAAANAILLEKAPGLAGTPKPDHIAEICRIFLRYRDGKLDLPSLLKIHLTAENLMKLKGLLDANSTAASK